MVFNSILLLAREDRKSVFKFLQEIFFANDYELTQNEKAFLYNALIEYNKDEDRSFKTFIRHFESKEEMYNILKEIGPEGKYGFFTNRKKVYMVGLDKIALRLTVTYLNIFGFGNIQN